MAEQRQAANLHNIATAGFDQNLNCHSLTEHHPSGTHDDVGQPTALIQNGIMPKKAQQDSLFLSPSPMDHPKLVEKGFYFLKGVDVSLPALSGELTFATQLANRNNPTTIENIHKKLTVMPSNYGSLTKEQQEAFCSLIDSAEMKQAIRLELKVKEKLIREQELRYLSTDYGLGNVVHGWDITSTPGITGGTDRQIGTSRVMMRRKIKDNDRIFSASSVMSFVSSSKVGKSKRLENRKKKRIYRQKMEKQRKRQMNLQRSRLNGVRDDNSEEMDESFNDESYTYQEDSEDDDEPDSVSMKTSQRKKNQISKKVKKSDFSNADRSTQNLRLNKSGGLRPAGNILEPGHRLRNLLTNKTPHGPLHMSLSGDSSGPIKLKIPKYKLLDSSSEVPPSPSTSLVTIDSNPATPSDSAFRRNRIRARVPFST